MVNTTGIRRGTRYMFSRDFRKRGKFFKKKALLIVLLGISRLLSDCFTNLLPWGHIWVMFEASLIHTFDEFDILWRIHI